MIHLLRTCSWSNSILLLSDPATPTPQVDTITRNTTEYLVLSDDELEKRYRVIIQNDDVTPMDFVVKVLRGVFQLTLLRAQEIMQTAHNEGQAYVVTLPLNEAQERVYAAHNDARNNGYPLTFYLEPEEN